MTTSVQFTVGKVEAGMAILLTEDNHLIEFPSLLLPRGVVSGSIVSIQVERNAEEEKHRRAIFNSLQEEILAEFGTHLPQAPILKRRSVTQTSIILEWEPLVLHSAHLKSIHLYKNNQRLSHQIPLSNTHFKLSGLDVDHEYEFYLQIKTSAGCYNSDKVVVRTHTLDNLTGVRVCFGNYEKTEEIESLREIISRIGASYSEEVDIDTTHLICRVPNGSNFEKASRWNVPIVKPDWLVACEINKKLQPALSYYLT